jgi:hypothetical protein
MEDEEEQGQQQQQQRQQDRIAPLSLQQQPQRPSLFLQSPQPAGCFFKKSKAWGLQ